MNVLRFMAAALCTAALASAELLDLRIAFQGTDCVSCAESLEGRLVRVRGVETVELNLQASSVRLVLEPGNQVRLGPLQARITQDGTKILSIEAVCRGEIVESDGGLALQPSGLTERLPLDGENLPAPGSVGVAKGTIANGRLQLEQWDADSPNR